MAFQDFDQISERRRLERKQKVKQRITIAVVVVVLLLSAAAAAFLIFLHNAQQDDTDADADAGMEDVNNDQDTNKPSGDQKSLKAVQMACQSTDYKERCVKALSSKASVSPNKPDDLVKASISVAADELDKAISQTSTAMKAESASEEEKASYNVCKQVLEDAQDDFNHSQNAAMQASDLNSWLSAVISYQQTCIDAIKDEKTKSRVEESLKSTKELTSNSLAIISSVETGETTTTTTTTTNRRLLFGNVDGDVPMWMSRETRRLLKANASNLSPNATVAKDGSGDFTTIGKALEGVPKKYEGRYVIHVKSGVYEENVIVTKEMTNITMYGVGSQKTIITGSKNFVDGVPTFQTATFAAIGNGFIAQSIGFRNTAGPEKHQAVALRVQSDLSIFLNCRMEGYQDTLYAQTHRQFYRGCYIMGTIDFIFGNAAAVFQTCDIVIRKPMKSQKNTVTAQGRTDKHQTTGTVLQKCKIAADSSLEPEKSTIKSYLGRPWKEYSRTIVMESEIEDVVDPEGWLAWDQGGGGGVKRVYYAEYKNIGAGSDVKGRVKWEGYKKDLKKDEAVKYTVGSFIQGERWVKAADVPVRVGFYAAS